MDSSPAAAPGSSLIHKGKEATKPDVPWPSRSGRRVLRNLSTPPQLFSSSSPTRPSRSGRRVLRNLSTPPRLFSSSSPTRPSRSGRPPLSSSSSATAAAATDSAADEMKALLIDKEGGAGDLSAKREKPSHRRQKRKAPWGLRGPASKPKKPRLPTATAVAAPKKKSPSLPPPPPDDWERWLPHETEEDYLMDHLPYYDYEKCLREDLEEYYMDYIWKPFLDYEEKEREKEREELMQLEVMQFEKDGKPNPPPILDLMQFLKDGKRRPPPKLKEIPSDDEYISKLESEPEVLPPKPPSDSNSVEKLEDLLDPKIGHPTSKKVIH